MNRLALALTSPRRTIHATRSDPPVPQIPFDSVPNFLKLPAEHLSRRSRRSGRQLQRPRLRVLARKHHRPRLRRSRRQLLEFDPTATTSAKSATTSTPGPSPTPSESIRKTTSGSPTRARTWSSSSTPKAASSWSSAASRRPPTKAPSRSKHPRPPLPPIDGQFRQVTDMTWDAAGNTYISDGYINSRVAKVDKNGKWLMSLGEPGDKPGQFNTPHSIAADAQGQHLRSRPRQPPHPGLRRRRQIPPPDHHRRARPAPTRAPGHRPQTAQAGRHRHHAPARPGPSASPPAPTRSSTPRTPSPAASTSSRSTAKCSETSEDRQAARNNSAGFTKSPAPPRTPSTSPRLLNWRVQKLILHPQK